MPIAVNGSGTITGISVGGLPDGIVDTDMLANNAVTSAKATGRGITEADTWKLSTSYGNTDGSTLTQDPIQNNLVRTTQPINGYLGTGMTLSSGIWTFPSTGYWLVIAQACMNGQSNRESNYNGIYIMGTVNNSSYVDLAAGFTMFEDYSTSRFMTCTISTICDITDVSTHKVKFKSITLNNTTIVGTTEEQTSFKFIRLGDT